MFYFYREDFKNIEMKKKRKTYVIYSDNSEIFRRNKKYHVKKKPSVSLCSNFR